MALSPAQARALPALRERVTALAAALPDSSCAPAGRGHLAVRRGRRAFAYLMVDHHGDGRIGLALKSTPEEQRGLVAEDARGYVPAYLGAQGWVALRLDQGPVETPLLAGLLARAHHLAAPPARRRRPPR